MTKKMDWQKARQGGKGKTSLADEKERRKGDRAARWLEKVEGKQSPSKPPKRGGRS